jgi:hypothetical protein
MNEPARVPGAGAAFLSEDPTGGDMRQKRKVVRPQLHSGKINKPSSLEEAKHWLDDSARFLYRRPYAPHSHRFAALTLYALSRTDEGKRFFHTALTQTVGKLGRKKGRPARSDETFMAIADLLIQGTEAKQIAKSQNIPASTVEKIRADLNKVLGKRQHGAKPDATSQEDTDARAAKIPPGRLTLLRVTAIPAEDILSDND